MTRHASVSRIAVFAVLAASLAGAGCGRLPNGRGWGQDVTAAPGWERVGRAARAAALSPEVWAPAGAALLLQIGEADRELSEWAADRTPVFGSTRRARDASTLLVGSAMAGYAATAVATPVGEQGGAWPLHKGEGVVVGVAAALTTNGITRVGKTATGRLRPDGSNRESFPSAHASGAAVFTTLASRNVGLLSIPRGWKIASRAGLAAVDLGAAWARVEGGRHYPSDVLVGMALGHFLGAFFNDAFMGLTGCEGPDLRLGILFEREGLGLALHWAH